MTPLRLRVDVCTHRGLRDGVPGILEILRRHRARATFFVTFGPDASGLALLKMLRPSFALKMLRSNAPSTYGWATAFYGTLLPAPLVGKGMPGLLRRIRDEGHEVGLHGWDHRRWQDRLPRYPRARLREEFRRMLESYREILGAAPRGFAAPAWMLSHDLLDLEAQARLVYASDTRGRAPFLPVFLGRNYEIPQLPVTLPTLDEWLGRTSAGRFVDEVLRRSAAQPDYACFTAHAETEGLAHRDTLEALLDGVGRPVAPLAETTFTGLPRRNVVMGRVEGRPYDVCLEGGGDRVIPPTRAKADEP